MLWSARAGLSRDAVIGLCVGLVGGLAVVALAGLIAYLVMAHRWRSARVTERLAPAPSALPCKSCFAVRPCNILCTRW